MKIWSIIAFLFITATSYGSYIILSNAIQMHKDNIKIVDLACRQRTLSQKIPRYLMHYLDTYNNRDAGLKYKTKLDSSVDMMRNQHEKLISGSLRSSEKLPQSIIDIYYNGSIYLNSQVLKYISESRKAINFLSRNDRTKAQPHIDYVLSNSGTLLKNFDKAVKEYQNVAEKNNSKLKNLQLVFFIATLTAILLTALFIFRPLLKKNNG